MLWRKEGWNIDSLAGGERVHKKVLFGQRGEQEHSKQREYQVQKLWSGNITVTFQEDREVIVAKAEVRNGAFSRRMYQREQNELGVRVTKGLRCCCKNFAFYSESGSHWRRFKSVSWLHTTLTWIAVADVLRKGKRKNRWGSWEAGVKVIEVT